LSGGKPPGKEAGGEAPQKLRARISDSGSAANGSPNLEKIAHGTNSSQCIEAKRTEISRGCRGRPAEVSRMIKTYGAPIPEATAKKTTAYLEGHYAPENRKE
jgi:hypothetical protein